MSLRGGACLRGRVLHASDDHLPGHSGTWRCCLFAVGHSPLAEESDGLECMLVGLGLDVDCAQVNYWPSKVEHTADVEVPQYGRTEYSHERECGERVQEDLFVGDDFKQAGDRIRSMDQGRWGPEPVLPMHARPLRHCPACTFRPGSACILRHGCACILRCGCACILRHGHAA